MSHAPAPHADRPPNLLFLFPDQWRWDWLGCEGLPNLKTPNIDALAARGVRFTHCRTNSPLCAPARACLATGRRYHRSSVPDNGYNLDPRSDTVFQRLRAAGYRVGASGKTDLQKHGAWKGLDGWTEAMGQLGFTQTINQCGKWDAKNTGWPRPQDPYMAFLHREHKAADYCDDYVRRRKNQQQMQGPGPWPSPLTREHYTDDFCGQSGLNLLNSWSAEAPWALWVNFPGPHEPFDPPRELQALYDGVEFPDPVAPRKDEAADHPQIRRNYAAMITGIDDWVGRYVDALEKRGELENTLIVFSSDHGEMLGDHGRWNKSEPFDPSVRVPLVAAGPGVRQGAVSGALAELIDISATLLDAAGLAVPEDWDARSLRPVLAGERADAEHRRCQLSGLRGWEMIADARYKLVLEADGERLFDLQTDPQELQNIIESEPEQAARLRDLLREEQQLAAPSA